MEFQELSGKCRDALKLRSHDAPTQPSIYSESDNSSCQKWRQKLCCWHSLALTTNAVADCNSHFAAPGPGPATWNTHATPANEVQQDPWEEESSKFYAEAEHIDCGGGSPAFSEWPIRLMKPFPSCQKHSKVKSIRVWQGSVYSPCRTSASLAFSIIPK